MSALAQDNSTIASNFKVTAISANARIDYILRFSKQAILVVDEQSDIYSQVANNYLGALSDQQNACFMSVSPKLNDIQIRCRIIEQLFGNALFDPEKSLAVSIFNIAKQNKEQISIVIEHVHLLSLQLIHELCQLAEIAKKADVNISVVMLGRLQAGSLIQGNKSLFENKLSILSASSGQLLSITSPIFKEKSTFWQLSISKKFLLSILLLSLFSSAVIYFLSQRDTLSFSGIKLDFGLSTLLVKTESNTKNKNNLSSKATIAEVNISKNNFATTNEIFSTLMGNYKPKASVNLEKQIIEYAQPEDIFNVLAEPYTVKPSKDKDIARSNISKSQNIRPVTNLTLRPNVGQALAKKALKSTIAADYYQQYTSGYVVQFSGFRDKSTYAEFVNAHKNLQHYGYYRQLNSRPLLVITSPQFSNRADAEALILSLPATIKARSPWIKSISIVNEEINAFESTP